MVWFGVAGLALAQTPAPAPGDQAPQTQAPQAQEQNPNQTQEPGTEQSTATAASDNQQADANPGSQTAAPVPLPLNLDSSSLQFSGERMGDNHWQAGIGATGTYDDNLLSLPSPRIGGLSYLLFSRLGVELSRRRLLFKADYEGGYSLNQRFSAYDEGSHSAKLDLRYRLSPHVTLRVADRFAYTTSFFSQIADLNTGTGIIQQPNVGIITPFSRHTDNLATGQLTYQYSAGDMVGVNATSDISSFQAAPAGAPALLNSRSEEGDAFYSHRFTPRNWSGIGYTYQRISFQPAIENLNSHSILLYHTIYLKRNVVLGFFAGPEYSQLDSQIVSTNVTLPYVSVNSTAVSQDRWSVAGGGSFNWTGPHSSFQASGVRKVSDGGGLLGAVDITNGIAAMRRQVKRNSTVEFNVIYVGSHSLDRGTTTFFGDLKSVSGSLSWEQDVGPHFATVFGYSRDYQEQSASAQPSENVNHNRGWVTVSYRFRRPLGR